MSLFFPIGVFVIMKNLALVLAVFFSVVIPALAQSSQSRVVDLNGNGVSGVVVDGVTRCYRDPAPPLLASMSTVTDAEGRFTWPDPGLISLCSGPTFTVFSIKKDGYAFTRTRFMSRPSGQFATYPPYDDRLPLIQATA